MTSGAVTHATRDVFPSLYNLCSILPFLAVEQRKAIVSLTRVQRCPVPGTRANDRLRDKLNIHIHVPDVGSFHLLSFLQSLSYLESPIGSGLISMLCRSYPYHDYSSVMDTLKATIEKESIAAREVNACPLFSWAAIFSSSTSSRHRPIAPTYPTNPYIHGSIHSSLLAARSKLMSKTLYPSYSRKSIGYKASINYRAVAEVIGDPEYYAMVSTLQLEVLYHRFGWQIAGETEIRVAWKFNDLKPRVYYARGADVYYSSRYIQEIFNYFVDALAVTNRFSRYHHSSVSFTPDEDVFIYDYSSFTSKLEAIKDFTLQLAAFCKGVTVTVIDTYLGPIERDVGEMIEEYYEACCNFPRFDFGNLEDCPWSDEYLDNHTCGMLGVPGNISSSTLLHGIHLIITLQSFCCKCVGDDAFAAGYVFDSQELAERLEQIGEISLEKMEFWMAESIEEREKGEVKETGWQYCKRPFDRLDGRLLVGDQYIFPPIASFGNWKDSFHTSRYESQYDRLKRCCRQLMAFARQFSDREWDDEQLDFLNFWLKQYLRESGILTKDGYSNLVDGFLFPRRITNQGFSQDMIEAYWNTLVTIPLPEDHIITNKTGYTRKGDDCCGKVGKPLALAQDLGHATIVPRYLHFIVRDDPELFGRFLAKERYRSVSNYVVFESCPAWLERLIKAADDTDFRPGDPSDPIDFYLEGYASEDEPDYFHDD